MAETRLERELRDLLTAELDAVHGPHPRWAGSPAARRVGRASARRPLFAAAALLAAAVVLAVAMVTMGLPWASGPAASNPATAAPTNEPLPSSVSPSASPTVGELLMGRVAISTQNGVPALAVRVISLPSAGEAVVRIDMRVVGPITDAVGASRFAVYHDGTTDPLAAGSGPDALAIPVGAPLGTTVYAEYAIPVRDDEWADLGYSGVAGSAAFSYPLHRPGSVVVPANPTGCPTLADYAAASAIPSEAPTPAPSFDPVATGTAATTGTIALGTVGVIAGPDGHAGALVRVSSVRLCDRLPDARPDAVLFRLYPPDAPAQFLFADLDLVVLQDSTIDIFLPDGDTVVAPLVGGRSGGQGIFPRVFWFPGINTRTSVSNGAGYSYHGVIGWAVPGGADAREELAIGVFPGNVEGRTPLFTYPVRAGSAGQPLVATVPPMTPLPSLTPTGGPLPLDTEVVLPIDGQVVRAVVGGVEQVPRYPAVAPSTPGDVFLEYAFESVRASGDYTWNPADWSVVLPDGSPASLLVPPTGNSVPNGRPSYLMVTSPATMDHAMTEPAFSVAEVPATGRITLEYRPNGGPAVATWVLRGQ